MAAVTGDQDDARRAERLAGERRRAALVAFLGAGVHAPPSTALLVQALAGARGAVAARRRRGVALEQWLAGEVRLGGLRENAAVVAAMETPALREEAVRAYRRRHPGRAAVLNELLAVVDRT